MALDRRTMKWRDFVEFVKTHPRERQQTFTRSDDDWPITVIADHPGDDEPHAFDAPTWIANFEQARHAWATAMGAAARTTKPTKLALIASTWQVAIDKDAPVPRLPPSRHPDRFEAVIVVVADAEIEEAWTARIKRRRYGAPLLGPWEKGDEVWGAMFDPWRDALR
jgi:hypothetical protein